MKVKFVKTHPLAKVPVKKHGGDFCYDVYAATKEQISENVFRYGLGLSMQIERRPERVVSLGKPQKELREAIAEECGVTPATVFRWLAGEITPDKITDNDTRY